MRLAAVLMVGGVALSAEQAPGPFDAGVSLVYALDSLKAVTRPQGLSGVIFEGGWNAHLGKTSVPARVSLSFSSFPGKQQEGRLDSLLNGQLAGDVSKDFGSSFALVAGLSLNAWRWDHQDPDGHSAHTMKGAKMGARFGFDYKVNERVTATLMLQMVELGTDAQATHGYNPSWIQAGARYRF